MGGPKITVSMVGEVYGKLTVESEGAASRSARSG